MINLFYLFSEYHILSIMIMVMIKIIELIMVPYVCATFIEGGYHMKSFSWMKTNTLAHVWVMSLENASQSWKDLLMLLLDACRKLMAWERLYSLATRVFPFDHAYFFYSNIVLHYEFHIEKSYTRKNV